jgi:hypothetical protein
MSDPNVIRDTSLTLRSLLEARLNGNGGAPPVGAPVTITVDSPHRGNQDEFRVNLFLYNVIQDEGRRNAGGWVPAERVAAVPPARVSTQRFIAEPLALRLYYLVTAFAADGLTEHQLLGHAMQVFYINRRIPDAQLRGTLQSSQVRADHVEINLLNLDIDTLQKIWGSQNEPPRTSVAYEVVAVFLDALEADVHVPLVTERIVGLIPFPYPATVVPAAGRPGDVVRIYGSGLVVPQPSTGVNLLRVRFGDTEAELLADHASKGAVSVRVPAGAPGPVEITAQLDRYVSRALAFDVLGPA